MLRSPRFYRIYGLLFSIYTGFLVFDRLKVLEANKLTDIYKDAFPLIAQLSIGTIGVIIAILAIYIVLKQNGVNTSINLNDVVIALGTMLFIAAFSVITFIAAKIGGGSVKVMAFDLALTTSVYIEGICTITFCIVTPMIKDFNRAKLL